MKRNLIMLVTGLVLVLAVGGYFVYFHKENIVKESIEHYASAVTGTVVTVADVAISPTSGVGNITDFTIQNPAGFGAGFALKMNSTHVAVDPQSLNSDVLKIDEIVMDNPEIIFEVNSSGNNYGFLRININNYMIHGEGRIEQGLLASKQILIKDFYLRNAQIKVIAPSLQNQSFTVSLPVIHLSNLGQGQGQGNLPQIMQQVMNMVVNAVVSSVGNVNLQNFNNNAPQRAIMLNSPSD